MIRDPSDGSVKESAKPVIGNPIAETAGQQPVMNSGLSTSKIDAKELAKLERSRQWLKDRREGKL